MQKLRIDWFSRVWKLRATDQAAVFDEFVLRTGCISSILS